MFAAAIAGSIAVIRVATACSSDAVDSRELPDAQGTDAASPGPDAAEFAEAAANYTMAGVYRCCLPDAGTSCCAGVKQGLCYAYVPCTGVGQKYEGKATCAGCCEGLVRTDSLVVGDATPPDVDRLDPACDFGPDPASLLTCIRCGDGICGEAENFCNCPADCSKP
jgi:hypothetical protein